MLFAFFGGAAGSVMSGYINNPDHTFLDFIYVLVFLGFCTLCLAFLLWYFEYVSKS